MTSHVRIALVASLSLTACVDEPEEVAITTQHMEGRVVSAELALDAPWRLEPEEALTICADPTAGCEPSYRYDKVPIVISVRDANVDFSVFEIYSIDVVEIGTPYSRHFELADLHEVEWTHDKWPWPLPFEDWELPEDKHHLCRLWRGDSCPEAFKEVWKTSEWDALLFYPIQQIKRRGHDVRLQVRLNYVKRDIGQDPQDQANAEAHYIDDVFDNEVVVHLGDAPLPRFGPGWAYGDLHYHSQGTDNEGEAGYGHRATLHAISALGLDFVLATEHASDSGQLNHVSTSVAAAFDTLRDMSGGRFRTLRRRLNDPDGANAEIVSFARRRNLWEISVPQLFLGGEVDAYPEVSPAEAHAGILAFGSTGRYALDTCNAVTPGLACGGLSELLSPKCTRGHFILPFVPSLGCTDGGELRYAVSDLQGVDFGNYDAGIARARQHMVYFPADPARADAFIASHTSMWGGGTRSLENILRVELEQRRKGAVFLAHPVDTALTADGLESTGIMRLGPDIVPYSEVQLRDAFASPDVLGLEAWNEDTRLRTPKASNGVISSADGLSPFTTGTTSWGVASERPLLFTFLHHGVAAWDRMLRWGIDPARTAALSWLDKGQVRRVYFAAGSDAHGDLNYRRAGYMFGVTEVNDTAIGKPRNLVFAGAPQGPSLQGGRVPASPFTQGQILDALRAGQFVATDGPIVRVAIDSNRNGEIDAGDIPMGGEGSYQDGGELALVVEWKSTPEFGPVTRIELVVGAHNDVLGRGMTFAPREHAVRTERDPAGTPSIDYREIGNLTVHTMLDDEYWLDPTGVLRFAPASDEMYEGRRSIILRPGDYQIGIPQMLPEGPRFLEPAAPDRVYVRAFAATEVAKEWVSTEICRPASRFCALHPDDDACLAEEPICTTVESKTCTRLFGCAPRMAFANPVWAQARRAAADWPPLPPDEVK